MGTTRLEPTTPGSPDLVATCGVDFLMRWCGVCALTVSFVFSLLGQAQEVPRDLKSPSRLTLPIGGLDQNPPSFDVPLPAHAQPVPQKPHASFAVESSRRSLSPEKPREPGSAEYLLPEDKRDNPITPEMANLNIPVDTFLIAKDTGEKIFLPAGTYRQLMKLPIDSPLMDETMRTREVKTPKIESDPPLSRYRKAPTNPVWVRYESLEKIKIGDQDRRGGLDIPSHGPENLGPRVWYAKSETADVASSAFYFVFGGLGYGIANLAGWSAGNTREIPNDFEYRLIRK